MHCTPATDQTVVGDYLLLFYYTKFINKLFFFKLKIQYIFFTSFL